MQNCSSVASLFEQVLMVLIIADVTDSYLDGFCYRVIGEEKSYKNLWFFIKIIVIFSYDQASVESGLSMNNLIMVEFFYV